jgi:hypothetical protein
MSFETNKDPNRYLENDDLWNLWRQHGITETTLFNVEFQFISKKRESASKFVDLLNQQGYKTKLGRIRKGLFNLFWDINLTMPPQTWTVEKLNQQARELHKQASEHDCVIDGIGAMMPRQ